MQSLIKSQVTCIIGISIVNLYVCEKMVCFIVELPAVDVKTIGTLQ